MRQLSSPGEWSICQHFSSGEFVERSPLHGVGWPHFSIADVSDGSAHLSTVGPWSGFRPLPSERG